MTTTVYNVFLSKLMEGINLETTAIRVALLNDQYIPSKSHAQYSDVSSYEITGSGYVAGGKLLSNVSVDNIMGTDSYSMSADDVSWDPSTITARVILLYEDVSKDLICSFVLDNDETSSNGEFTIQWNTDGILKVS